MEAIKKAGELSRRHHVVILKGQITLAGAKPPGTFLETFRQAEGLK